MWFTSTRQILFVSTLQQRQRSCRISWGGWPSGATTTFKSRISQINPTLAGWLDWKTGTTNSNGICGWCYPHQMFLLGGLDQPWQQYLLSWTLTGYNNNAQYMAQLANAIYQADPRISLGFGLNSLSTKECDPFWSAQSDWWKEPGRVNVNSRDIVWAVKWWRAFGAKNGAPTTQYHAIGGSG